MRIGHKTNPLAGDRVIGEIFSLPDGVFITVNAPGFYSDFIRHVFPLNHIVFPSYIILTETAVKNNS
jgi:hypothetical protein